MASSILFLEQHDKNTIWQDVDFATSLQPDYLQFSQLGPIPGTKLYDDYEKQGKLIRNIPYESQHGQGKIWFQHEYFSRDESKEFIRLAFELDYNRNGASLLRNIKTTFEGYLYCRRHPNDLIRERSKTYRKRLALMRNFLTASTIFVQNRQSEILLKEIKKLFHLHFGRTNLATFATSMVVVFFSVKEYLRTRIMGDVRVPKTACRNFRNSGFHERKGKAFNEARNLLEHSHITLKAAPKLSGVIGRK